MRQSLNFLWRFLFLVVGLACFIPVVVTPLDLQTQALFAVLVYGLCFVLDWIKGRNFITLLLVIISTTVSTRYIYWRITSTLIFDSKIDAVFGLMLMGAEIFAFIVLLLGYLQTLWPLPRVPAPLPEDMSAWPTIDVYIPTYNEPLDVVRTTILAARAIDWPSEKLRIYVLDDGKRDAFRAFAAQAGVGYIVRPDNKHAKAGNLNHAMTKTRGELIAIFDCDHIPTRSFLQVTAGWFLKDPRLAMVQTPHHFYSPDPFEKNLDNYKKIPNEGELFYGLIQPCHDTWNAAFFCGSCALIRRKALAEVGGIAVETVTEDAHTALKMQRRGWNTAYLHVPQAGGLATESLSAHVGQRIRWARGMAQIFRIDNPFLGRGLTFVQRACYSASMLHFFSGIPRIIFLLSPLSFLLFGLHIFSALPLAGLAYGLPHLLHTELTNARTQGKFRHSLWSQVYETVLSFYIAMVTTRALVDPKAGTFNVTAKGGTIEKAYFEKTIARPYLVIIALNLIGIGIGAWRLTHNPEDAEYIWINLVWTGHNMIVLVASLAVAWEQKQLRTSPRVNAKLPATLQLEDGRAVRCNTVDLARGGIQLSSSTPFEVTKKQHVWVTIFAGSEERAIPAEVVRASGGNVRLKFLPLSIDEEAALTQAMFSRADAWLDWDKGRTPNRPLLATFVIAGYGWTGLIRILRGLMEQRRAKRALPDSRPALAGDGA
jgi:cellulose synthase (UDP-forming)